MAWFNASWLYRFQVTIDHTKVPGDLTNFAVGIALADAPAGFWTHLAQSDGGDIRVTLSDGTTEVPVDVAYIDTGSSVGELYFKVTGTLSSSVDTIVYVYYGNAAASMPASNATYGKNAVWSAYSAVYHLSENANNTTNGYLDSKGTFHGTGSSMALTPVAGRLGGRGQDFDGTSDEIALTTTSNLVTASTGTITAWLNTDNATGRNTGTNGAYAGYHAIGNATAAPHTADGGYLAISQASISGVDRIWSYSEGAADRIGSTYTSGTWHHIGWRHQSSNLHGYKDGASSGVDSSAGNTGGMSLTMYLGTGYLNASFGGAPWNGKIDEVRFATTDLGANWIATEYNNLGDPGTFYDVGAEEQDTPAGGPFPHFIRRTARLSGGMAA